MLEVTTSFSREGSYLDNGRGRVSLGSKDGAFYPYDLLLGSLAACWHATLLDILRKQKMDVTQVDVVVTGEKREEVPTTLRWANMAITAQGVEDRKKFEKAGDLAGKYCSIHHTLSLVADMTHTVDYK